MIFFNTFAELLQAHKASECIAQGDRSIANTHKLSAWLTQQQN